MENQELKLKLQQELSVAHQNVKTAATEYNQAYQVLEQKRVALKNTKQEVEEKRVRLALAEGKDAELCLDNVWVYIKKGAVSVSPTAGTERSVAIREAEKINQLCGGLSKPYIVFNDDKIPIPYSKEKDPAYIRHTAQQKKNSIIEDKQ